MKNPPGPRGRKQRSIARAQTGPGLLRRARRRSFKWKGTDMPHSFPPMPKNSNFIQIASSASAVSGRSDADSLSELPGRSTVIFRLELFPEHGHLSALPPACVVLFRVGRAELGPVEEEIRGLLGTKQHRFDPLPLVIRATAGSRRRGREDASFLAATRRGEGYGSERSAGRETCGGQRGISRSPFVEGNSARRQRAVKMRRISIRV
jgi:hypothetical protein